MATELRALVIDDERPARARLCRMLARATGVTVVGEADDGVSAVNAILAHAPDVVFLDIQMPNGDGFAVVASVGPREMPAVVFVTAHDEHALRAFEARAVDYLLKPVHPDRLDDALDRVRTRPARSVAHARRVAGAVADVAARAYLTRLVVREGERQVPVHVDRIDWVQADRNDVWVHVDGRPHLLHTAIGAFARRLDPARFAQVNRSSIVRIDAVRAVRARAHGDCDIELSDGTLLVWSRRYRMRAPDALGDRMRD